MIWFHLDLLIQRQCSPFSLRQAESNVEPWYVAVTSHGENEMLIGPSCYLDVPGNN